MACNYSKRESYSSAGSVWVDRQDSNDWIAPCIEKHQPTVDHEEQAEKKPLPYTQRRISSASDTSDARELWECMLELQQRYGCYRSARMEAAISVHDDNGADLMPSTACLDLLNESIVDEELPEDGWKMLEKFLPGLRQSQRQKSGWKFWKKR